MTDRLIAVDGAPLIGEHYRFVKSPLGKGFLAPYITFDPNYGESLRRARQLSSTTGIMPMALVVPSLQQAVPSSMYTHETPYTLALGAMKLAEEAGTIAPGSVLHALVEAINGNLVVEIIEFGSDESE